MRYLIVTSFILFWAAAAPAQQSATFEWKGGIQPRQTLEIRNINGDIKAEAAGGTDLEIAVRITGTRPDPATVRIDVVPHDGGILVCTIYQGLTTPERCSPGESTSITLMNSDIRVTYTVKVPAEVNFTPKTVNGSVTADLPESGISASTVNGRVILNTSKAADAHVVNGSIVATLGKVEWSGSREFAAVNGSIDIEVPEQAQANVRAATVWGNLANDFGIPVHRNLVGNWFSGEIAGGGPLLVLGTVIGSIHLRHPAGQ